MVWTIPVVPATIIASIIRVPAGIRAEHAFILAEHVFVLAEHVFVLAEHAFAFILSSSLRRQPCSGKSKAGLCLVEALKESWSNQTVGVNDEASFHLDRNQSYFNMPAEKNLRGVLRSKVDRSMSKDNTIIVDSLNNIKGCMYELWCLARAAGISQLSQHRTRGFSEANFLYELDRATQEVTNAIVEAQSQALVGPLNGVSVVWGHLSIFQDQ
ncbi:hypothetical protein M0R45_000007 [Rubus argutus]|uniref:Uncharacterized protein n=1 Tax=Rubus argutus TaxID=59490 RepID=A0AAW1VPB8_RUBAR